MHSHTYIHTFILYTTHFTYMCTKTHAPNIQVKHFDAQQGVEARRAKQLRAAIDSQVGCAEPLPTQTHLDTRADTHTHTLTHTTHMIAHAHTHTHTHALTKHSHAHTRTHTHSHTHSHTTLTCTHTGHQCCRISDRQILIVICRACACTSELASSSWFPVCV